MPRSSIFEPSDTEKSAVTRIRSSCKASRSGRNATSSLHVEAGEIVQLLGPDDVGEDIFRAMDRREMADLAGIRDAIPGCQ